MPFHWGCETPERAIEKLIVLNIAYFSYLIQIEPDDALPKCLCVSCMKQLEQAHEFKIQCEETDRKWRERLSHKVTNKNNTTRQEQDNYEYEEARFIYDYSKDNRESVFIKKEEIFEPECHLEDTEILQNSSSSEKEDDPNSGDEAPDAQSSFSDTPAKKEISVSWFSFGVCR